MKKILYFLSLFSILFFSNKVFGYSGSGTSYSCDNIDDFYIFLDENASGYDNLDVYDSYEYANVDLSFFLDSADFNNSLNTYPYYYIIGNRCYMFNKPLDYLYLGVRDYRNLAAGTLSLSFTNIYSNTRTSEYIYTLDYENRTYSFFGDNSTGTGYSSGYSYVVSSFTTKYYTKNYLTSLFIDSNVDLKYNDGSDVVSKLPVINTFVSYNDSFTQATLSAEIINATGNENLYYSDDMIFNSGLDSSSSGTQHSGGGASFDSDLFKKYTGSLTYSENKVVVFRVLDSNGNIVNSTSVIITDIGTLNSVDFIVDFDTSNSGYLIFTPRLNSSNNAYFSIYSNFYTKSVKIDSEHFFVSRNGSVVSDASDDEYSLLANNETIYIKYTGIGYINLDFSFEIRNKSTGNVVLTRKYSYKLKGDSKATLNDIIENGKSLDGIGLSSLNENSNINDIINSVKTTFNTFGDMFALLPGFVWAFLGVVLVVLIVLRVLGR